MAYVFFFWVGEGILIRITNYVHVQQASMRMQYMQIYCLYCLPEGITHLLLAQFPQFCQGFDRNCVPFGKMFAACWSF